MWSSVTYDYGNEHDPISPIGRVTVELSSDGNVHVTQLRGTARREWHGKQAASLWPSVIAALEKAKFPNRPEHGALVAGTSSFSVRTTGASVTLPTGVGFEGYRELSGLMMSVIGQTSADILGFEMPDEPRLITLS